MATRKPQETAAQRFATAPVDQNYSSFVELGATGLREFGGYVREEWVRELQGRVGVRMFKEMRDNDPVIGAMFFAIEMLLRSVRFSFEPETEAPEDVEAGEFLEECLSDMEQSWPELMSQFLTFLTYGWQVSEIVYKIRGGKSSDKKFNSKYDDRRMGWRKFAMRSQETLLHWEFDESGDASALVQLLPTGSPLLTVPLSKCLHLKTALLKNNPEGRSVLRNAYTSYYFKKRIMFIEANGIERDLCGLPVAWVPPKLLDPQASAAEKAQLVEIKRAVRDTHRNEQEGHVWPLSYDANGNKIYDLTLLATGGRRQFTTNEVIDRYDQRIAATMLADFITLGSGSSSASGRGSTGQSGKKMDMFALAVGGFLDLIVGEFNRKATPDILALNGMDGRALLHHSDISEQDIASLGDYVSKLASSGMILPDDQLESHLREKGGLPVRTASTGDITQGAQSGNRGDNVPNDGEPPDETKKPETKKRRR